MKKAFTMVELLLVMGIFAVMAAIGGVNYFSTYNQTSVGLAKDVLISDLRSAQNKAMSGSTVNGTALPSWGLKLLSTSYVIFPGPTYTQGAAGNYIVDLPTGLTVSTTFPSSQILFDHGTGEASGYNSNTDTITLTIGSSSKNIELNNLGVITSQ